jgi:cell fate (sporulation/competence/biofilm development) regulator YlbF (YheA/YmcA/DUF963 family)
MRAAIDAGHEEVLAATRAFIDALKATGPIRRFVEANQRFDSDQEVQSILKTLQQFQDAQRTGKLIPDLADSVREAQIRLRKNAIVKEFLAARDAANSFLQETNVEISQVLGVNFAQTAGPAGGNC